MVLESIIRPSEAEKSPWEMFFLGILYSSIGLFFALFLFGDVDMSLVMVFLTTLACSVLMYKTIRYEESKTTHSTSEYQLLRQHGKALAFFTFLFLGFIVSFSIWYTLLPLDVATDVFSSQINAIERINSLVSGNAVNGGTFLKILENNLRVLIFSVVFSFFYGMGAIYILTWNASVIGAAIGQSIKNALNAILASTGAVTTSQYFHSVGVGLSRYLLHGLPEILAFFIGGLAGGLISVGVIRYSEHKEYFRRIVGDAAILLAMARILVVVGAYLEVYVTPYLFR